MRNLLLTLFLACLFGMARGQTTAIWWFDHHTGPVTMTPVTNGSLEVDASELSDGIHTLHIQGMLPDGSCTSPELHYFLRVSEPEVIDRIALLCSIDGELYTHEVLDLHGGLTAWDADLSGVSEGLHRIMLQAVTSTGEMTNSYSGLFFRIVEKTPETLRYLYMIDNDEETTSTGIVPQDGIVHLDLDLSTLSDGLHSFTYYTYGDKGGCSLTTRYFVKIPLGGNKMTRYEYWVNDNVDQVRTTVLSEHQDPLQVIDLLPVEQCPLRSELFHFECKDDQPIVYAKNTLKARFYDRTNHFGTVEKDFIDYSVSAPVTVSGELKPGEPETTAWPEANTVKWYTLSASQGESLQFKLSCAATIQLFAPSGAEVYRADGVKAVNWGGQHANETGTYYVALHDVTAKNGSTINIDYERIDRYAVLKQDVMTVGNGGPSTITFEGNGFDELQSVDLVMDGHAIASVEVKNSGKAEVAVKFDFNGAELGVYDAVFHFTDGNLEVKSCITVEKAVPVKLKATVQYASKFLVSKGNNYVFKVTNRGNMTAYDVPMTILVYSPNAAYLKKIGSTNCTLGTFTEDHNNADIEGYPYKRTYTLNRTLRPGATESFTIHVKTTERIYVYLTSDVISRTGGPSTPVSSLDPNDIYGYQDAKGDKTIRGSMTQVYYTIEFENDPEFATAPAHDIYVTDVLDPQLFDLSAFYPTRVKVGSKEVELDGSKNGSVTFSMMPEIYAIAQLDWSLDEETGTVSWHISSLDPLTVEPTEELMNGVLPVNTDGNGIGELSFDIQLKPNLPDGTEIPNYATIVFDENDPIVTPTWTNVIEGIQKGDANGDGTINVSDAIAIICYILGDTPLDFNASAADLNNDGKVTVTDALIIIMMYKQNP